MKTRICRDCKKPKNIDLYSPGEWKNTSPPICMQCTKAANRNKRVGNPVPADYSFNASIRG